MDDKMLVLEKPDDVMTARSDVIYLLLVHIFCVSSLFFFVF